MGDKDAGNNHEKRRDIERDYDVLKGALVGLSTNDWAKSVLMRCLDKLYEAALTNLEPSAPSARSGSGS